MMWSSDRKCYVDRHGVDPRDDCSLLIFFSEVNKVHSKYSMTKKEITYLSSCSLTPLLHSLRSLGCFNQFEGARKVGNLR